jgi:hypothetical protein
MTTKEMILSGAIKKPTFTKLEQWALDHENMSPGRMVLQPDCPNVSETALANAWNRADNKRTEIAAIEKCLAAE